MNEHLTSQYCHNPYQTDTELNRRKDKCKERDKPSDNNEHSIPSTSNDNDTTASRAIEYPWLQTGNTLSSNIIDIIYDKLVSRVKICSFYSQVRVARDILKKQRGYFT